MTRPDGVDPTSLAGRPLQTGPHRLGRSGVMQTEFVIERGGSVRLATALRELWISGAGVNKPDLVALVRAGGGS